MLQNPQMIMALKIASNRRISINIQSLIYLLRKGMLLFHDLLYHASYPNTSGEDRWALISTYKDGTKEDPEYKWASSAFTVTS